MKLVHYLSLIFLLLVTLTSPTLLASVPVSIDPDGDSLPDSRDTDEDDNGVLDSQDAFHLDKRYSKDTDSDGLPDKWEIENGRNPSIAHYQVAGGVTSSAACSLDDNSVQCWGNNRHGQTDVPVLRNPVQVNSRGTWHTWALDDNGVHFQVVFSFHLAKALPKNAKCSTQEAVLQEYFSAKVASSSGVGLNNILGRTQTIT